MKRYLMLGILVLATALLGSTSVQAQTTVQKPPDQGPYWAPINNNNGTYVYADSFVAPEGGSATSLGTYLLNSGVETGPTIRFEVWGDNSGPDSTNVIASTGSLTLAVDASLTFFSAPVAVDNAPLAAGMVYWFVATVVGEPVELGSYQTGGHTQNSVYNDDGTFWFSNDPAGVNFDGQNLTPEMAFEVQINGGAVVEPIARFLVTKTFSDESTDEVDVTLTCNGGLPLVQDFTIAGDGPGVTFVVTDLPDTGANCAVTESGGPAGYTPVMIGSGGAGCEWGDVTSGFYSCTIVNEADPATFTVNKVWEVNDEVGGDDVIRAAEITITCDAEIEGGYQDMQMPGILPPGYDDWMLDGTIIGDGSLEATVDTSMGPVMCEAEETSEQSGVETIDDCGPREIAAGESSECTITNTVFFEGIPSLNQYGLAIMALLMLGMGMVGFRRFA